MAHGFGTELLRDQCPKKYYSKKSLFKDIVPIVIAAVIVSFFSGSLLKSVGLGLWYAVLAAAGFVILFSVIFFVVFGGIKKRLSRTYISVMETGISGIYAINGYRNASFGIPYEDITFASYRGERAVIETKQGKFTFVLEHAPETVELICKQANI